MKGRLHQVARFAAVVLALILAASLSSTGWVAAQANDPPRPLDVILLIDTSDSMGETDPLRLREDAATYLADFLAAAAESLGLRYRMSAAAFDETIRPGDIALTNVAAIDLADIRDLLPEGNTDFGPALDYAGEALAGSYETERTLAVVLLTDGQPRIGGQPVPDPDTYFEGLGDKINELGEQDVHVFVVGIGDAELDRRQWEAILPNGNFVSIPSLIQNPNQLYEVYTQWFGDLIGLEALGNFERLEDGSTESFNLDPFVEHVIISVVKDDPAVTVSVQAPDETELPPPEPQPGRRNAVFQRDDPMAGTWRLSPSGGGIYYYVWQRNPSLRLRFEPQNPWADQSLYVEATDLSDRLAEAGDQLELELEGLLDRRTVFTRPMEFQPDVPDVPFVVRLTHEDIPEAGSYQLRVRAEVGGVTIENLIYQQVSVEVFDQPAIGMVYINDVPYPEDPPPTIEVDPQEPLNVVAIITEAEQLGQDITVQLKRPNGELVDMVPAEPSADEVTGERRYAATIAPEEAETTSSLLISLRGTANTGERFEDYYVVNVEPRPLPPTIPPTTSAPAGIVPEVSTATPTATATPPPPPSFTQRLGVGGIAALGLGLLAALLLAFVGLRGFRRPDKKEDDHAQEFKHQLAEAVGAGRYEEFVDESIAKINEHLNEAVEQAESDIVSMLEASLNLYHRDDDYDWPKFYQFWGAKIAQQTNHQPIYLGVFARFLLGPNGWSREKDPFFAIEGLYDLLQQGLPVGEFVELLAKNDQTMRGLLFGALANVISYPSDTGFTTVRAHIGALASESANGYARFYDLLKTLYRTPTFSPLGSLAQSAIEEFKKPRQGPPVLAVLLQELVVGLQEVRRPENKDELDKVVKQYEALKTKLEIQHPQIPEAKFLRQRIETWIQVARQEQKLFAAEETPFTNGRLLVEVRPSLDIFEPHERRDDGHWGSIQLPVTAYATGDAPIIQALLQSSLKSDDSRRPQSGPSLQVAGEFLDERLEVMHAFLDLTQSIVQPTTVAVRAEYQQRYATKSDSLLREKTERTRDTDGLRLAPTLEYLDRATLHNPYVPYSPLNEQHLTNLHLSALPPVVTEMQSHFQTIRRENKKHLISLRGLRWSGKTTTINMLIRLLHKGRESRGRPPGRFMPIRFDLLEWLHDQPVNDPVVPDAQLPFMMMVLKGIAEAAKAAHLEPAISAEFETLRRQISQGTSDLKNIRNKFHSSVKNLARKDRSRLVLVFDEADIFAFCGNDIIYDELARLCIYANVIIVLCHDLYDTPWYFELRQAFSNLSVGKEGASILQYEKFYTEFMSKGDVKSLLEQGSLRFTDLAVETVWAFTGGYAMLVQHLCYQLTEQRRQALSATVGALETGAGDEPSGPPGVAPPLSSPENRNAAPVDNVYVTVSAQEVKDFMLDFADQTNEVLGYLVNGFSAEEYLLMMILAAYHVDTDTAILRKIRYSVMAGDQKVVNGLDDVIQDLEQFYPNVLEDSQVKPLFRQLVKKEVLQPVQVQGEILPLLRWRIGWLMRYMRQSADSDLEPLLQSIKERREKNLF